VELSGTDLRKPDVHVSVTVRQKRDELTVARYGSGLRYSIEIRNCLKSRVSDRASPEILCPTEPDKCGDGQRDADAC
jgi:hypothetical protein